MKEARRELVVEQMSTMNERVTVKVGDKEVCWLTHEEAEALARLLLKVARPELSVVVTPPVKPRWEREAEESVARAQENAAAVGGGGQLASAQAAMQGKLC